MSEWRADPFGRFEERMFIDEQSTAVVRSGGIEQIDTVGGEHSTESAEIEPLDLPAGNATPTVDRAEASPVPRSNRSWVFLVGGLLAATAVATLGAFLLGGGEKSRDETYLAALSKADLLSEFAADRAAIANATAVCTRLDAGDKPQGSTVDNIGVETYCADYLDCFKVLSERTVNGTFSILDSDSAGYDDGDSCEGEGGYGDLNASTQVVVKNNEDKLLARTALGTGTTYLNGLGCKFRFIVDLTEGEDEYLLKVGDRGLIGYTWDEITEPGRVALVIG